MKLRRNAVFTLCPQGIEDLSAIHALGLLAFADSPAEWHVEIYSDRRQG